jgi:acyl-CoA dehydrogenase
VRLVWYGLGGALFSPVPGDANDFSRRWYQRINHLSVALATCADVALGVLGGELKRRELLSARLGDAHSQMLIACSVLKYHATQPAGSAADAHAAYALQQALYSAQQALLAYCANFPRRWLGCIMRIICFPLGRAFLPPADDQIRQLGDLIMEPNPVRQALAAHVYLSDDPEDAVGRVETTYQLLLSVDKAWQAVLHLRDEGGLEAEDFDAVLREAVDKGVIREQDIEPLREYDARRFDCLLTDHFEQLG